MLGPKTDDAKRRRLESMYQSSRRHFPEVPEVTVEELRALQRENNIVLVDVRAAEEQQVSMIPGAVAAQQFEASQDEYKDATVVTYCTIGHRSGLYAKNLQARGWKVLNLKGAVLAWTHAGGELENTEGQTRRVHVCTRHCNLAAEGYEAIW
jgi:rhodanese-related sulfurtransferase